MTKVPFLVKPLKIHPFIQISTAINYNHHHHPPLENHHLRHHHYYHNHPPPQPPSPPSSPLPQRPSTITIVTYTVYLLLHQRFNSKFKTCNYSSRPSILKHFITTTTN
ncbi:hypothetical protein Hanom_Chr15g01343961 [Helianthus anomalus]